MSKERSKYYVEGWNAFIDGLCADDNPYTMTCDAGWDWDDGHDDAYNFLQSFGSDDLYRKTWQEK